MFKLWGQKSNGKTLAFEIEGMHCVSCAMNIDGALEDTPGVISATTNFAKARLSIEFDPTRLTIDDIQRIVAEQGYTVKV
jgi:copper chaperone CopZ